MNSSRFPHTGQNNNDGGNNSSKTTPPAPAPNNRSTSRQRPLNVPPMRISNRLRRVDVRNDSQFENMRRRLLLEDLEADIKAKRAYEQAQKSQRDFHHRQT